MELYVWLEKRGWKPKWHTEPQDSIDFTIKNIQKYLQRLVVNEGSIGDQVADRQRQMKLAEKLDEEYQYTSDEEQEAEQETVYEGAEELEEELDDDEDGGALN